MTPDTIAIKTSDGERHFNPENISFLRSNAADNKNILYVICSVPAVLMILLAVFSDFELGFYFVIGGVVASIYIYGLLVNSPVSTISTINNEISINDGKGISEKLSEGPLSTISITGTQDTLLKTYYYEHKFVVDNIVSIEEREQSLSVVEGLILAIFVLISIFLIPRGGFVVSGIGVLLLISSVGFAYILLNRPNITVIELQGGEKKEFVMTREDSGDFVTEFQQKA